MSVREAAEATLHQKLKVLLESLRDSVQENRQKAAYEKDNVMKSWLDGRASAYANAAAWLSRVIQ